MMAKNSGISKKYKQTGVNVQSDDVDLVMSNTDISSKDESSNSQRKLETDNFSDENYFNNIPAKKNKSIVKLMILSSNAKNFYALILEKENKNKLATLPYLVLNNEETFDIQEIMTVLEIPSSLSVKDKESKQAIVKVIPVANRDSFIVSMNEQESMILNLKKILKSYHKKDYLTLISVPLDSINSSLKSYQLNRDIAVLAVRETLKEFENINSSLSKDTEQIKVDIQKQNIAGSLETSEYETSTQSARKPLMRRPLQKKAFSEFEALKHSEKFKNPQGRKLDFNNSKKTRNSSNFLSQTELQNQNTFFEKKMSRVVKPLNSSEALTAKGSTEASNDLLDFSDTSVDLERAEFGVQKRQIEERKKDEKMNEGAEIQKSRSVKSLIMPVTIGFFLISTILFNPKKDKE